MYSLSIDYIFNRIYDVLLWVKYTWLFSILRKDPGVYLEAHEERDWEGLRDRGWFDEYLAQKDAVVPPADVHISLWQQLLESLGIKVRDSDGDGIPDITDSSPFDKDNLSKANLKERYQEDYTFSDTVRDLFGIGPKDSDNDGVPDSYEIKYNLDPNNPDSDRDGVLDGEELITGTAPLNNDTDGDLVLDGRDEAPLDSQVSSLGLDTDGDGVSDTVEKHIGTDTLKLDTDGDGIGDNMDTYPLDSENLGQVIPFDLAKNTEGIHFSIQNPVLSLFADVLSVLTFIILLVFVYAVARWLLVLFEGFSHFDHHFYHNEGEHQSNKIHIIEDKGKHEGHFSGVAGLPVGEIVPPPPTAGDFNDHPKFAVIQGYMSSESEALWRIGIMEADNLLLEILTEKGYVGEGVGEKLKEASFKTIDLAWDAHKIRNRIAHEGSDFQLTEREAKKAFMFFESVFRDLKAIR
jgi:hypothetical protein